jgi:BirA family biotin operon repressor/biotin-[acetyl-CoA-carboxylase] ligase
MTEAAPTRFARVVQFEEIDSTNSQAWRELEAGSPDGTVVIAGRQTGGRGRLGRQWSSPGGNLYVSILRRMVEGVERAGGISLVAAVAMADSVERVTGVRVDLKWPNDLWVHGRKLAGILLEGRPGRQEHAPAEVDWQVIGVGINVNVPVSALSPDVHGSATTLLELTGRTWSLDALARGFLERFAELEAGPVLRGCLPLDEYLARFPFVGQRVAVYYRDRQIEGAIAGIDGDGALLADCEGQRVRVVSGEVIHVRPR